VVVERKSETNQDELESLAKGCNADEGCEGRWYLQPLSNGANALFIVGPDGTSVGTMFLSNGVLFDVLGPTATFTPDAAQQVAETLLNQSENR
jgi:hypothetical protein